jgi:hypothetical protein
MGSNLAIAENRGNFVCICVARQIDPGIAPARVVGFIDPKIDDRTKALQVMSAARREAKTRLAGFKANLAFHETEPAAAATNTICAVPAMAAIAPITGALASLVSDGWEIDRLPRGIKTAARLARIKSLR